MSEVRNLLENLKTVARLCTQSFEDDQLQSFLELSCNDLLEAINRYDQQKSGAIGYGDTSLLKEIALEVQKNYEAIQGARHDIFGVFMSQKLDIESNSDVAMATAVGAYYDAVDAGSEPAPFTVVNTPKHLEDELMKHYSGYQYKGAELRRVDVKEFLEGLPAQTPDNFELTVQDGRITLHIIDWKVGRGKENVSKTMLKYYATLRNVLLKDPNFSCYLHIYRLDSQRNPIQRTCIKVETEILKNDIRAMEHKSYIYARQTPRFDADMDDYEKNKIRALAARSFELHDYLYSVKFQNEPLMAQTDTDFTYRCLTNEFKGETNLTISEQSRQMFFDILESLPSTLLSKSDIQTLFYYGKLLNYDSMPNQEKVDLARSYKVNNQYLADYPHLLFDEKKALTLALEEKESAVSSLYETLKKKTIGDQRAKLESRLSKRDEQDFSNFEADFQEASDLLSIKYGNPFISDIKEGSMNHNFLWSPNSDITSEIAENSNLSLNDEHYKRVYNALGSAFKAQKFRINDFVAADKRMKARKLLKGMEFVHSCTEYDEEHSMQKEEVFEINPETSEVKPKMNTYKPDTMVGKHSIRRGHNDFYLGMTKKVTLDMDQKASQSRKKFFSDPASCNSRSALMQVMHIGKPPRTYKKLMERNKERKDEMLKIAIMEDTEYLKPEYEHEAEEIEEDDKSGMNAQELFVAENNNRKLFHFQNPNVLANAQAVEKAFCNLLLRSAPRKTNKIKKVVSAYDDILREGMADARLSQDLITEIMNKSCLLDLADDIMQISKGILIADKTLRKNTVKVLQCSNPNLLCYAFRGDGYFNKGSAGVPHIYVNMVKNESWDSFKTCYDREIALYAKLKDYTMVISWPMRLDSVRTMSLFKSPAKILASLPLFLENGVIADMNSTQKSKLITHLRSAEKKNFYNSCNAMDESERPVFQTIAERCVFMSYYLSTVTKINRMGLVDIMRYAAHLPLGDYSNIHGYIREKFEPTFDTTLDVGFLNNIITMLKKMEGIKLSDYLQPVAILDESEAEGGLTDVQFYDPITQSFVPKIDRLLNNIYLAVYLMPKSLHNHFHNLTSLINVPAEWESKFREVFGFSVDEPVKPKPEMMTGVGKFSFDFNYFLVSSVEYLKTNVREVGFIRQNILNKEGLLKSIYKIDTMNSSKKCAEMETSPLDGMKSLTLESVKNLDWETIGAHKRNIMRVILQNFSVVPAIRKAHFISLFGEEQTNELVSIASYLADLRKKPEMKLLLKPVNEQKMHKKENFSILIMTVLLKPNISSTETVNLRSQKVSEVLFDFILKKQPRSLESMIQDYKTNPQKVKSTTFMEFFEQSIKENIKMRKYKRVWSYVSIFEKHQRTKTDREIYLMSFKQKASLYFMESIMRNVANLDPSEAISIKGDYKIKGLATMAVSTLSKAKMLKSEGKNIRMTYLSADQSKWSASDNIYRYAIFSHLCHFISVSEQALFSEILSDYVNKHLVIPADIFALLHSRKSAVAPENQDPLYEMTKGYKRNNFPVSSNWLQGNLNFFSSVLHSVAMTGTEMVLREYFSQKLPGCVYHQQSMVHSDDNASAFLIGYDKPVYDSGTEDSESEISDSGSELSVDNIQDDFPKQIFHSVEYLMSQHCITMNTKKTYCSSVEVEFISERCINNDIIPLYCRDLANCSTESSHLSYYDDVCSLAVNLIQCLRKSCPSSLYKFIYSALQVQCLSIYSMLPGEINSVQSVLDMDPLRVPLAIGGWLSQKPEVLALAGVQSNDLGIVSNWMCKVSDKKIEELVSSELSVSNITQIIAKDNKQVELATDKEAALIQMLLDLIEANNEDLDWETSVSAKSNMLTKQIATLPVYSSEYILNNLPSFRSFCRMFPGLETKEKLLEFHKKVLSKNKKDLLDDEDFTGEKKMFMNFIHDNLHLILIAPENDMHFLVSKMFNYFNADYRNKASSPDTEILAVERILKSRSKCFKVEADGEQKEEKFKMLSYSQLITEKFQDAATKIYKTFEGKTSKWNSFLTKTLSLIKVNPNVTSALTFCSTSKASTAYMSNSRRFKFFRQHKFEKYIQNSPGLVFLDNFCRDGYLQEKDLPSASVDRAMFEKIRPMIISTANWIVSKKQAETAGAFKSFNDVLEQIQLAVKVTNSLMILNTSLLKKNFPMYVRYNSGFDYLSCASALVSTMYSYKESVYFIATTKHYFDPITNKQIQFFQTEMRTKTMSDMMSWCVKTLDELTNNSVDEQTIRTITQKLQTPDGENLYDYMKKKCSEINSFVEKGSRRAQVPETLGDIKDQFPLLFNVKLLTRKSMEYYVKNIWRNAPYYVQEQSISRGEMIGPAEIAMSNEYAKCHLNADNGSIKEVSVFYIENLYSQTGLIRNDIRNMVQTVCHKAAVDFRYRNHVGQSGMIQQSEVAILVYERRGYKQMVCEFNTGSTPIPRSNIVFKMPVHFCKIDRHVWEKSNIDITKKIQIAKPGQPKTTLHTHAYAKEDIISGLENIDLMDGYERSWVKDALATSNEPVSNEPQEISFEDLDWADYDYESEEEEDSADVTDSLEQAREFIRKIDAYRSVVDRAMKGQIRSRNARADGFLNLQIKSEENIDNFNVIHVLRTIAYYQSSSTGLPILPMELFRNCVSVERKIQGINFFSSLVSDDSKMELEVELPKEKFLEVSQKLNALFAKAENASDSIKVEVSDSCILTVKEKAGLRLRGIDDLIKTSGTKLIASPYLLNAAVVLRNMISESVSSFLKNDASDDYIFDFFKEISKEGLNIPGRLAGLYSNGQAITLAAKTIGVYSPDLDQWQNSLLFCCSILHSKNPWEIDTNAKFKMGSSGKAFPKVKQEMSKLKALWTISGIKECDLILEFLNNLGFQEKYLEKYLSGKKGRYMQRNYRELYMHFRQVLSESITIVNDKRRRLLLSAVPEGQYDDEGYDFD